jgi:hypothetical protein
VKSMRRSLLYGIAANLMFYAFYLYSAPEPLPKVVSNSAIAVSFLTSVLLIWLGGRLPQNKSWGRAILFWIVGFLMGAVVIVACLFPTYYTFGGMPGAR